MLRRERLTPIEKAEIVRLRTDERLSSLEIAERMNSNTITVCEIVKPFPLSADEMKVRKARTAKVMRKALSDRGHYIGGGDWSEDQIKILKRLWPARAREKILEAFPDRSWAAIGRQASLLGIRRSRSAAGVKKKKRNIDPFFQALREIREARGITREELADKAGFHRIHFARIELGECRPSWFVVRAWLQALGHDIKAIQVDFTQRARRGKRQWLIDEENILRELLAQGSTLQEISSALKWQVNEVEKQARTLGLLESEATRNVSGMTKRRLG